MWRHKASKINKAEREKVAASKVYIIMCIDLSSKVGELIVATEYV